MSIVYRSLLLLSAFLLLSSLTEQIGARYILAPKKVYPNSPVNSISEHGADAGNAENGFYFYPNSRLFHYLNKRGPEIFIPLMEV